MKEKLGAKAFRVAYPLAAQIFYQSKKDEVLPLKDAFFMGVGVGIDSIARIVAISSTNPDYSVALLAAWNLMVDVGAVALTQLKSSLHQKQLP